MTVLTAGRSVPGRIAHARRDFDPRTLPPDDLVAQDALELHTVAITDARDAADGLVLDDDGFALRQFPTATTDFFDLDHVESTYLPEVTALVRDLSGASAAVVLEQVIRGPRSMAREHPDYGRQLLGWALKAHVDADEATFREWAAHVAEPELVSQCRTEPFAVYNVWRPIAPVQRMPLAFCHAPTVRPQDLVPAHFDGRFPGTPEDEYYPTVRYFHLAFNPDQRWYYFRDMQPQEVAVFKQWDSDGSRARCVPHTAFEDPTSSPGAPPRQSIEVRVFALR